MSMNLRMRRGPRSRGDLRRHPGAFGDVCVWLKLLGQQLDAFLGAALSGRADRCML